MSPTGTSLAPHADEEKGGTFWPTVFNLFNNMIGSGILSMGDGTRFGSFLGCFLVFIFIGWVQLKTMALMGTVCKHHQVKSFRELWEKVVGSQGAWMIDVFIGLNAWFACISYCLLVCQYFTLSTTHLLAGTSLLPFVSNKPINMAVLGTFVMLPIAMYKNLHQLKFASYLGLSCMVFALVFLNIDSMYWASTEIETRHCEPVKPDGHCTAGEVFESSFFYISGGIVQTIAICVSSLMCHYNIPKFYAELKSDDPAEFNKIVYWAGFLGIGTYFGFAYAGFLRFGTQMPKGNILGHYDMDTIDPLERTCLLLAYFGMSVSLMLTMPMLFNAFRVSLMQLTTKSGMAYFDGKDFQYKAFTSALIAMLCGLGLLAPDLTLITRLKGNICGMSVSVILPAVLFWKTPSLQHTTLTRMACIGLALMGVSLSAYGLKNTFLDYV